MTLNELMNNWLDVTQQKRRQALQKVIDYIDYEGEDNELLAELLWAAAAFEENDYFGTEGLQV